MLDSKLSFSSHVNYIKSKISKSVGIIFRLSSDVPKVLLARLYYALVLPYLNYCNIKWGGCANAHLNEL